MADLSFNVGESLASGAKGMQDFLEVSAAPSILKQAYAGATPEQMADPMQRKSVYEQAAMLAGQKGLNALSYNFQKQASELTADAQAQQLNNIKIKQGEVAYANQLVEGASDEASLQSAVAATVKDPAARMQVESILRNPNLDFQSKKGMLLRMTMTAKERLDALQLTLSEQEISERVRHDKVTEKQKETDQALEQSKEARLERKQFADVQETEKARYNTLIKDYFTQGILPNSPQFPQYLRDYLKTGKTQAEREQGAVAVPTEERAGAVPSKTPITGDKRPLSQRYNNPGNITDSSGKIRKFDTLEEGEAALDKEIGTKLSGKSAAYKRQFKDMPVTPARLAQVWSPADAPGNSVESTGNYAKYIAAKLGIPANQKIEDTPENRDKIKQAITEFEAGPGSGKGRAAAPVTPTPTAAATAEDAMFKEPSTTEMYDTKRGGGLTPKEWSTINPTAVQIGKEYKVNPMSLTSATTEEKKQAGTSYQVTKLAENTAEFVKDHTSAVGTLAAITQQAMKKGGNILDNIRADKRYTGDVAEMGKRLFALGLKDAGSAGRLNVYLEKQFAEFYEQSKSPETLLRIIKSRQEESFENLNAIYGADKSNLDKAKYKLAFADDVDSYLGKSTKASAGGGSAGARPSLDSFDRSRKQVPAGMPTR